MTVKTVFGHEVDSDELRDIARQADELAARLASLDPAVLTPQTLASSPEVIARHLRNVADLVDRRSDGAELTAIDRAYIRLGKDRLAARR